MALLSVEDAQARVLEGVEATQPETVAVDRAHGRILAAALQARLTQPPFPASAMDGYAVCSADVATLPATLTVIGAAAAGHPFAGSIGRGEAVRIFTGAPVPDGADAIVIQENTARDGARVIVREGELDAGHVRPRGMDFSAGETLLASGQRLGAGQLALAAAMGHGAVVVRRRPRVAVLSTGDELVAPGGSPGPGQVVACNQLSVTALAEAAGAEARQLGIARDDREDLSRHVAEAAGADILVTIGGVSVGDHDLVGPVLSEHGMTPAFWRINMRPGKPLMYGRMGEARVLGLPGNPAAALVGARLFLVPLIWRLLGRSAEASVQTLEARLGAAVEPNGSRQFYMHAVSKVGAGGIEVTPLGGQHSSLITPLAEADCLVVRPPRAPAVAAGSMVPVLRLDV